MCMVTTIGTTYHGSCGIAANDISPTVLYKDNAACVTQMSNG